MGVSRTTFRQAGRRKNKQYRLTALLKDMEVDYDMSEFGIPDGLLPKRTPKLKAASSPKLEAASSPKLKVASSPKVAKEVVKSEKAAPKASVADIMEEAAEAASAVPQDAAPAEAGAGKASKGKKRKK